VFYLWRCHCC